MNPHAAFLNGRACYLRGQPYFPFSFSKSVLGEGTHLLCFLSLCISLALITTTVFDLQFKANHDTISSDESHWVSDHCCYMLFSNALSPTLPSWGLNSTTFTHAYWVLFVPCCSKSNDVADPSYDSSAFQIQNNPRWPCLPCLSLQ